MDDFDRRYQKALQDLDRFLRLAELNQDEDLLYHLACDYAADHPGEYYVTLPGIILPLFS